MSRYRIPAGMLTLAGVAQRLGVSASTVERAISSGRLAVAETLRLKPRLFFESDVHRLAQGQRIKPVPMQALRKVKGGR